MNPQSESDAATNVTAEHEKGPEDVDPQAHHTERVSVNDDSEKVSREQGAPDFMRVLQQMMEAKEDKRVLVSTGELLNALHTTWLDSKSLQAACSLQSTAP